MSLRSVGAALLVAVWCVRATLCLSAEHSQWVSLTPLGGSGAIGSPGGTHPIVADGQTVHVVWAEHARIHYQRSTDAGATWGQRVSLASHGTAQYPCSLEVSEAAVHLIWPDSRNGRWEIYYRRSGDAGTTWGPERKLTSGVNLFRLGTAISGATIHVVWGSQSLVRPTPGGTHTWGEIYYKRSTDGGATWGEDVRLTQADASAMRPAVAACGQYVHVTWFDRRDSKEDWDWEVYYKRSTDGGAKWDADVRMTNTPTHTRHPQIVATSQRRVCCIWEDGQSFDGKRWSGDPGLYAALSADNGQTWDAPRRITFVNAPHGWATHAKAFAHGSRIHLAWTDAPDGTQESRAAYYMTSRDGGLTWGTPERLTSPSDGETWAQAVTGTESYAIVVVSRSDRLSYRRTLAGAYYDGDTLGNPKGWLESLDRTPGALGIMYTTWRNKYELLAPFGDLVSGKSPR